MKKLIFFVLMGLLISMPTLNTYAQKIGQDESRRIMDATGASNLEKKVRYIRENFPNHSLSIESMTYFEVRTDWYLQGDDWGVYSILFWRGKPGLDGNGKIISAPPVQEIFIVWMCDTPAGRDYIVRRKGQPFTLENRIFIIPKELIPKFMVVPPHLRLKSYADLGLAFN